MSNVILLSGLHDASEEETGFDPSIDPEMAAEGGWGEEGQESILEEGAYDYPEGDAGEYQAEMGADGEPTDEAAYQDTADWLMQGGGQAPEAFAPASGGSWGGGGGGTAPAAPQDPYAAQAVEEEVVPVACESGYAAVKRTDGKWVCVRKTGALQDESPVACPSGQSAVQRADGVWVCVEDPAAVSPGADAAEDPWAALVKCPSGQAARKNAAGFYVCEPVQVTPVGSSCPTGQTMLSAPAGSIRRFSTGAVISGEQTLCVPADKADEYSVYGWQQASGCPDGEGLYREPGTGRVMCQPDSMGDALSSNGWSRYDGDAGTSGQQVFAMKAPGKAPVKVTARLLRAAGPAAITWKKSRPTAMFFSPVSKEARGVQRLAVSAPVSRQMIQRATMANAVPRVVLRAARPAFQPMMKPTARVPAAAARQVARVAVANKQVRR